MTFPLRFRRARRAPAADSQITDGHSNARAGSDPCTAEVAECTCPEFCERDHGNE
jgi:hypothetical protein